MRVTKTSPTIHLKRKKFLISESKRLSFNRLVEIIKPYEDFFHKQEEPSLVYELWTGYVLRTTTSNPKNKRILFASAVMYEKFNAFYFYPLYVDDSLAGSLHPTLQTFMTGRTAFHISDLTDATIGLLEDLLKQGFECYQKLGWIRIR